MLKYWTSNTVNTHRLILISNEGIHKAIGKSDVTTSEINQINNGEIPSTLFTIPFTYIKRIEKWPNQKDLKLILNDNSEDYLRPSSEHIRSELFEHLSSALPSFNYLKEKPWFIGHIKAPLIALLVSTGLLLWTLFYVVQIKNGKEYVVTGASLGSIAYGLATLGLFNVLGIFGIFIAISIYALIKRKRNYLELELLIRQLP